MKVSFCVIAKEAMLYKHELLFKKWEWDWMQAVSDSNQNQEQHIKSSRGAARPFNAFHRFPGRTLFPFEHVSIKIRWKKRLCDVREWGLPCRTRATPSRCGLNRITENYHSSHILLRKKSLVILAVMQLVFTGSLTLLPYISTAHWLSI